VVDNPTQARHHYQHALTLYTDLGTPEADQIRAHPATVDDNGVEPQQPPRPPVSCVSGYR